ncbi:3'-5' exonuclease, partial [Corynebacterium stationis]
MEKTWDTLINPECAIANSSVHKITDVDVAQAPTFADIANTVALLLAGRMMVAHNASFEQRFLRQEFARLG